MTQRKTLLIDFDGVMHDYKGWQGELALNDPIPKARAALYILEKTYRLICFTTRKAEFVTPWLKKHGFPEMKVTNLKEPAFLIIDDRAITFQGAWDNDLIERINSFAPHWETSDPPAADPVGS